MLFLESNGRRKAKAQHLLAKTTLFVIKEKASVIQLMFIFGGIDVNQVELFESNQSIIAVISINPYLNYHN